MHIEKSDYMVMVQMKVSDAIVSITIPANEYVSVEDVEQNLNDAIVNIANGMKRRVKNG